MRMNQDERRFDFHGLGLALKQAREARGWTQAYVAELVGKTDKTIMNIENKGQHPSLNLFFKLVTLLDSKFWSPPTALYCISKTENSGRIASQNHASVAVTAPYHNYVRD